MAARPLLSSMARFCILVEASNVFHPKSMALFRKSPGCGKENGENWVRGNVTVYLSTEARAYTYEFSSASKIPHDGNLKESNERNNLDDTFLWDRVGSSNGTKSNTEVREFVARGINVSGQEDTEASGDLSQESKHTDTAMLDLNFPQLVESALVGIGNQTQGIEETKRRLGTQFGFERHVEGGRGRLLLGRSESSGGGNEGGENSRLHGEIWEFCDDGWNRTQKQTQGERTGGRYLQHTYSRYILRQWLLA